MNNKLKILRCNSCAKPLEREEEYKIGYYKCSACGSVNVENVIKKESIITNANIAKTSFEKINELLKEMDSIAVKYNI